MKSYIFIEGCALKYALIIIMACLGMSGGSVSAKNLIERESSIEDKPLTEIDDDLAYALEDVCDQPEFTGGTEAMYQWIGTNFQYPPSAAYEGSQTRIILKFVVTKTGDIDNVTVQHDNPALRKEAIRVVNAMPKWTPGRNCDGEPVNVVFILPIQFKLNCE